MSTDPDTLVDRIYEASLLPELWRPIIDAVCAVSGSATGSIMCVGDRGKGPRGIASEYVDETFQRYCREPAPHDLRISRAPAPDSLTLRSFVRVADLLSAQERGQDASESLQGSIGLGFQVVTRTLLPEGTSVGFTFERWRSQGSHTVAELARLDALRPHLARAAVVSARLSMERARSMVATLEALGLPAAALTADGRVRAMNPALEKSGLLLPDAFGKAVIASAAAQALFDTALREGTRSAAAPVVRSIPVAAEPSRATAAAVLHLVPIRGAACDVFADTALLLMATTFGAAAVAPDLPLLHALFDLTPREAELCLTLAAGHSLQAAAGRLGIRFSTARAHLEHVFSKTGTHRQAELVLLLLRSAQPIAMPT